LKCKSLSTAHCQLSSMIQNNIVLTYLLTHWL